MITYVLVFSGVRTSYNEQFYIETDVKHKNKVDTLTTFLSVSVSLKKFNEIKICRGYILYNFFI